MPKIAPFKATFPAKGIESEVAIDSNVSLTKEQLLAVMQENPFSYYHVFKPQTHFKDSNSLDNSFAFGKNYFKHLKEQKILIKDEKPALYVYQIVNSNNSSFLGLISTVDINDYENDIIKKHENTLTEKQAKLFKHIEVTGFIGEPVLLTYPSRGGINEILHNYIQKQPDIDFEYNENHHKYWKIQSEEVISELEKEFAEVEAFYIADGHHRTASVCQYIKEKSLPSCGLLSYLVSDEQLKIYPFYRMFTSKSAVDIEDVLERLKNNFKLESANGNEVLESDEFLILFDNKTVKAKVKSDYDLSGKSISEKLNVSLLETMILKPIFNVEDSRIDTRLNFLSGKISIDEIKSKVNSAEVTIAFALAPLTAQDIFEVSDKKLIMPPKSTFVEPKLLSGSLIMEF